MPRAEGAGKPVFVRKHAAEGMLGERDAIREEDLLKVLEDPDHDDGHDAWKRLGRRTIIVRYREADARIVVVSVSATRRRLPS